MNWLILFTPLVLFSAQIRIESEMLEVEIADTLEKRMRGLSYRTELAHGKGMLFIFDEPQTISFWMKNTRIPLSIAFFNEKRELLNYEDMEVPSANAVLLPVYRSVRPAKYALEVPRGWFKEHKVSPGAIFYSLD